MAVAVGRTSSSKEKDFWEFGQRAALRLPNVGFVTTTDIDKSALHPPDKQDIAPRMALEIQRCDASSTYT